MEDVVQIKKEMQHTLRTMPEPTIRKRINPKSKFRGKIRKDTRRVLASKVEVDLFLEVYSKTFSIYKSCKEMGIDVSSIKTRMEKDQKFYKQIEEVRNAKIEHLEAAAYERAANGVDSPVFFRGEVVGYEKKYSDGLAQFMLKAYKPEMYDRPTNIDLSTNERIEVVGVKSKLLSLLETEIPLEGEYTEVTE
jgi:hypothetical protein